VAILVCIVGILTAYEITDIYMEYRILLNNGVNSNPNDEPLPEDPELDALLLFLDEASSYLIGAGILLGISEIISLLANTEYNTSRAIVRRNAPSITTQQPNTPND